MDCMAECRVCMHALTTTTTTTTMCTRTLSVQGIVERYGDESIEFGDTCNLFDSHCAPHRRVLVLTNEAIYVLGIVPKLPPPPPKGAPKPPPLDINTVKDFYFGLYRRIALADVGGVSTSQLADDYLVIHVINQHDTVLSCRRKTEFLAVLQRQKQINITFSNKYVSLSPPQLASNDDT